MKNNTDRKGRTYGYVEGDPFNTRIYTLANGLKVYLSPNDRKPEIQVLVGVRTGANSDPEDATGLAHYLEHLMFKGTKSIGTTDYQKEKPLLDEIEDLFERYGMTTDPEERKAIYRRIDKVSNDASKIAIAQECSDLFESIGARDMNAATGDYRTFFKCVIPSTEIERWAIIESERFANPVFRGFHTELETVYEEYNMGMTNDGIMTDRVLSEVNDRLYSDIPYCHHAVIGKPEHLKNPSLKKLKEFYKTYYCANNMAVVLSGDLDFERTMDIMEEQFGKIRRNDSLPEIRRWTARDLTSPVPVALADHGQQRMYLAWKIPGMIGQTESEEEDTRRIIMALNILSNGDCGLLEDLVNKFHKALSAQVFVLPNQDYSTLFLAAQPNEGQTFDDLRDLLLELIWKLKSGDFEDRRLSAAINQDRRERMENITDNMYRAETILTNFTRGLPYDQCVTWCDRFSEITREDVMNVARRYLTDGYIYVTKLTGGCGTPAIEKPEITPIEVGSGMMSDFARDFLSKEPEAIEPRFPDFSRDLSVCVLPSGQKLVYRHNDVDSIFSLSFRSEIGCLRDRWLYLAPDVMDQSGTASMDPDERKMRLQELASDMDITARFRWMTLDMSGLHENFRETLEIAGDWVLNARPEEDAFRKTVLAFDSARYLAKDDGMSCQKAMVQYATFGRDILDRRTITRQMIDGFSGREMADHVQALARSFETITYYGPASLEEVKDVVGNAALAKAYDGTHLDFIRIPFATADEPEVLIMDYDFPSALVSFHAGWGACAEPGKEAVSELLNKYLSAVSYQEIRESRSLAYTAIAGYSEPVTKDKSTHFYSIATTQNAKIRECIETTEDIFRNLPLSETLFDRVKQQMAASLRTKRCLDCDLIDEYMFSVMLGYDHSPSEDMYRDLKDLTLQDIAGYHRSQLGDHPFRICIVGRISEMDMDYLKSKGRVRVLSKEEVFRF